MDEQKMPETNSSAPQSAEEIKEEKKSCCPIFKCRCGVGRKIIMGIIVLILIVIAIQVVIADKYRAQVLVIEGEKKVGVNPTTEMLDFGDLSGDTSATRLITMKAGGMDTFVHIIKFGSIAELIKISENDFVMKKGDAKKLELAMYMPPSAPVGTKYSGNVWIFKIPKVW
jgi:amino acid transporter